MLKYQDYTFEQEEKEEITLVYKESKTNIDASNQPTAYIIDLGVDMYVLNFGTFFKIEEG